MPEDKTCPQCKGEGSFEALVSPHDDKKEWVTCTKCNGTGVIHQMTEQEEDDYMRDWW